VLIVIEALLLRVGALKSVRDSIASNLGLVQRGASARQTGAYPSVSAHVATRRLLAAQQRGVVRLDLVYRAECAAMAPWMFIVLAIAAATPATVYRCPGQAGETLFSDEPCVGGVPQTTQPLNTVDLSHLSPDEQATLDSLNQPAKHGTGAPVLRTNSKSLAQDERRCEAARDGLDRVRATKRRGYRASSAATLDARERGYEAQRDRSCARP
jgi:hypothetical protein